MKIGITVDDTRTTKYTLGKYDFYTREVPIDEDLINKIQQIDELFLTSQRIMNSLYNSNGRFALPDDVEKLKCVEIGVTQDVPPTAEAVSAKPRKKQASAAASSSASQKA